MASTEEDRQPAWLIIVGIGVGLTLLAFGVSLAPTDSIQRLSVCTGIALILGALGTRAFVERKGWAMVGAGAVALILYMLPDREDASVTFGMIKSKGGRFPDTLDVLLVDDDELLGAMRRDRRAYRFVLEEERLRRRALEVNIGGAPLLVSRDSVAPYLQSRLFIEWTYDPEKVVLVDDESGRVIGGVDVASGADVASGEGHEKVSWQWVIPGAIAWAADSVCDERLVSEKLEALAGGSARTQMAARDALVRCGRIAAPVVMDRLCAGEPSDPRWTWLAQTMLKILRNDAEARDATMGAMPPSCGPRMARATTDPSALVRQLATPLLIELGDRDLAGPLIGLVGAPDTLPEGRYNSVLALEGIWGELGDDQRSAALAALTEASGQFDERTRRVADGLGTREFFLVLQSFKTPEPAIQAAKADPLAGAGAEVYLLATNYYAVTLKTPDFSAAVRRRREMIRANVAKDDAWVTTEARFVKKVYPETAAKPIARRAL